MARTEAVRLVNFQVGTLRRFSSGILLPRAELSVMPRNLSTTIIALALLILPAAAQTQEDGAGMWWVSHGNGAPLQLRLYPDGSAWSDYPSNNPGTWHSLNGDVVCRWADGWSEVLRRSPDGWVKLGFKPGAALDRPPSNSSHAVWASVRSDGWFGPPSH